MVAHIAFWVLVWLIGAILWWILLLVLEEVNVRLSDKWWRLPVTWWFVLPAKLIQGIGFCIYKAIKRIFDELDEWA